MVSVIIVVLGAAACVLLARQFRHTLPGLLVAIVIVGGVSYFSAKNPKKVLEAAEKLFHAVGEAKNAITTELKGKEKN